MFSRLTPSEVASVLLEDCYILMTETTGLDEDAEIIEIAIVSHAGQCVYQSLVKPQNPIPDFITQINGIDNNATASAPRWSAVWPKVAALLNERAFTAYNLEFQLRMINQSNAKSGLPDFIPVTDHICTMKNYADFYGMWDTENDCAKRMCLATAAKQQGVNVEPSSHRITTNTSMIIGVLSALAKNA